MSDNNRWVERFNTNLKVRFGQECYTDNGRVQDISMFGFFIKTTEVFAVGKLLNIQLLTPQKQLIKVQGLVQWGVDVSQAENGTNREAGMGIEIKIFTEGREYYKRLCQEFWKKEDHQLLQPELKKPDNVNKLSGD
jgi:Tfp pilus assembly protein PilZ